MDGLQPEGAERRNGVGGLIEAGTRKNPLSAISPAVVQYSPRDDYGNESRVSPVNRFGGLMVAEEDSGSSKGAGARRAKRGSPSERAGSSPLAPFEEAHNRWLQALRASSIEAQARQASAYHDYLAAMAQLSPADDPSRWLEAYNAYVTAMLETLSGKDLGAAAESAYVDYVEAVKAAWSQLSPDVMGPGDLAAIAGSLMAVASTTSAASLRPSR